MSRITGFDYKRNARNALAVLPLMLFPMNANATDFTAGVVMEKMNEAERFQYLAGVIEGLAYSRYMKDGKKADGMKCIYQWFYKQGTASKIEAAFKRFHDYLPGAVVAAMVEKECGA
jgi:hypothetical protein